MNTAFEQGSVGSASTEQLQQWQIVLSSKLADPDASDSERIVRSLAINHIQSAHTITKLEETIERLNKASDKVQSRMKFLATVGVVLAFMQLLIAGLTICRG